MKEREHSTIASASDLKWHLAHQYRQQQTPAEAKLWERLRARRLLGLKFRRQHVIEGFIADFYCHALRLVIEVDGSVHITQREYDRERDRIFTGLGLRTLRFSNEQVLCQTDFVLARIEITAHHLSANRGESGTPPPSGYYAGEQKCRS